MKYNFKIIHTPNNFHLGIHLQFKGRSTGLTILFAFWALDLEIGA